jgi:hypothetical protein
VPRVDDPRERAISSARPSPQSPGGAVLSRRERFLVPLAGVLYVALAFLTEPSIFRATDFTKDWLPNRTYQLARLRAGELPLWNPYVELGRPFLANIDTSTFYPSTALNVLCGLHLSAVLMTMAHLALGAVFMTRLAAYLGVARPVRWLTVLAFLGSAQVFMPVYTGGLQYGWGICYLPLAFELGARLQDRFSPRVLALLAMVLALQLLTGWPQVSWITWLGLGSLLAGRALARSRPAMVRGLVVGIGGMAAAVAGAFLLAAVQLLPLFELVGQSNRSAPTVAGAAEGALSPARWLLLVIPAGPASGASLLATIFVGVPVVMAGLCGLLGRTDRNRRGLGVAALLAALVASGQSTPAFEVLFHVVPGLSSFHFHARATLVVMLALVLAGGLFLSETPGSRRSLVVLFGVAAALLAGTVWWYLHVPAAGSRPASWLAYRCAVVVASAALLAAWRTRPRRGTRAWSLAGFAVLTALELGVSIVGVKRHGVFPGPFPAEKAAARMLEEAGRYDSSGVPPRVALPMIRDNSGVFYGYSTVTGYVTLALGRVWSYLHEGIGVPYPVGQNEFPSAAIYEHGPFPYDSAAIALGYDPRTRSLRLNPHPDPRAYLAERSQLVSGWPQAIALMRGGHDFHRVALVETPLAEPLQGRGGAARIVSFEPERLRIEVEATGRSLLVVAEPWYPGWRAAVDGRPAPCLPANAWMRAVPVPPGRSRVEMTFHSNHLRTGAIVSLATLALLGVVLLRKRPVAPHP